MADLTDLDDIERVRTLAARANVGTFIASIPKGRWSSYGDVASCPTSRAKLA